MSPTDTTDEAAAALDEVERIVRGALAQLASEPEPEAHQSLLYDLAHTASALAVARSFLTYADHGPAEEHLVRVFSADVLRQAGGAVFGAEAAWATGASALDRARRFVAANGTAGVIAEASHSPGEAHLSDEYRLLAETFRRFGSDRIWDVAETVHREGLDVPEEVISGLAELGCFGMSIPERYGGHATGDVGDMYGMIIATEELSRASLGIGGSLITRPEILARAIETGGTEQQKLDLLPRIASGELMAAVAVTEPDHGSDVAALKVTATPAPDGGHLINGVKTWCTFAGRADVLMVLARTVADADPPHRGLSIFVVPKERAAGKSFALTQPGGGRMEGRAIPTLGYRGMHSFEVAFDDWLVDESALVAGPAGAGRGFYLQMAGFENGRLQTAARAVGVMQRAYDEAVAYASERNVFGSPLDSYELTRVKLGRMAAVIQACRQYSYAVGELMALGEGTLEAAMIKAYACKAAEWVTREAMQIHGGYGYAEEYPVSRLFVDARVLSIFEGADETLCLRLIGRRLLDSSRAEAS
jgi:(2S)-methylsuccinyl-CoA dehydrogenase